MGGRFVQTTDKTRERIMKLHREGLSYSVIAQRTGYTARTVSRTVKRELELAQQETEADAKV